MFPLHDENKTTHPPVVTLLIIVACALAWFLLQGLGSEPQLAGSLCSFALIPGKVLGLAPVGMRIPVGENLYCVLPGQGGAYTLLTHMFLHGGWFHLLGNMWFLWVFGDNIEDAMGPFRFLAFYLLCGLAAAAAQMATGPGSVLPMVGASGAIGGVMGGYARLYPHARVHTLLALGFFFTTISVPAYVMLGYWFLIQLLAGIPSLSSTGGGVAFFAHIGGFLAGVSLVGFFLRPGYRR